MIYGELILDREIFFDKETERCFFDKETFSTGTGTDFNGNGNVNGNFSCSILLVASLCKSAKAITCSIHVFYNTNYHVIIHKFFINYFWLIHVLF